MTLEQIKDTWGENYTLYCGTGNSIIVIFHQGGEPEEIEIENATAKLLISELNLIETIHPENEKIRVYDSEETINNKISQIEREIQKKNQELYALQTLRSKFQVAISNKKIDAGVEKGFDAWEIAKNNLSESNDFDEIYGGEDEISEKFKQKLLTLESDYWKKALEPGLSYEEEYLAILQYNVISGVCAEMGREHGKGTFGYFDKLCTKEEREKMWEAENRNMMAYIKNNGYKEYEAYEGVHQDGNGGWYYEELECK